MANPSWYEHVDLMQVVIVILILIVGWFIRRDFSRFEKMLNAVSDAIDKKADKVEVQRKADEKGNSDEHVELWKRVNHHGHIINCNQDGCKPQCGRVVISEEPL